MVRVATRSPAVELSLRVTELTSIRKLRCELSDHTGTQAVTHKNDLGLSLRPGSSPAFVLIDDLRSIVIYRPGVFD